MKSMTYQTENVNEAMRRIIDMVTNAKKAGHDILGVDVGERLNPDDVYDAINAVGRTPVIENILEPDRSGAFPAIFLFRFPDADIHEWKGYVDRTFDKHYVTGFLDGYRLIVPETGAEHETGYLRGVYDGVMAHAAVF